MKSESQTPDLGSRWQIVDPIAKRGGNGCVYRASDTTGEIKCDVAIKVLSRHDRYHRFKVETMTASGLNHCGIVPILDSHLPIQVENCPPPYFVMPWCANGALSAMLGCTQDQLSAILLQMLAAVEYIHGRNLAHRDIKPSNLLLDADGKLKLADFGLVFDVDEVNRNTLTDEVVGSLGYRAPEMAGGRYGQTDHRPADIFSIGRTIWALSAGEHPLDSQDLNLPDFNLTNKLGGDWLEIQDLVRMTTATDPNSRPTIDELINHFNREPEAEPVETTDAISVVALLTKVYSNDGTIKKREIEKEAHKLFNDRVKQLKFGLVNACRTDPTFLALQSSTRENRHIRISQQPVMDGHRFFAHFPTDALRIVLAFKILPVHPNQFTFLTHVEVGGLQYPNSKIEFTSLLTENKKSQILGLISRQMKIFVSALEQHAKDKLIKGVGDK